MTGARALLGSPIARQTLAGAIGGLLVFLLLEPGYAGSGWQPSSLFGAPEGFVPFLGPAFALFFPGAVFAGLVTALLVVADDLFAGDAARAASRGIASGLLGLVLGSGYSVIGHAAYAVFWSMAADPLAQAMTRAIAWGFFGLGVGLTAGMASRNMRRAYHGCAGGLIGGFAGGVLFGAAQWTAGTGGLSRAIGFIALGACVGLATALVERFTRSAWVVFLTGAREGQQLVLTREENWIGRDELADIPLFGDAAVDRRHAVLTLVPFPAVRALSGATNLSVQGYATAAAALVDGDVVQVGKHRFRFHFKGHGAPAHRPREGASKPAPVMSEPIPVVEPAGPDVPEFPTALRITAGAETGVVVRLLDSGLTIGREMGNSIPLSDRKVSRYHARIERIGGCWVLTDLGSTNGTRLNGLPVTRAGLQPGDFIYVGDTVLAVER